MKKNYYYEESCITNYEVKTYEDGVLVDSKIVPCYDLGGYIERLENKGYNFGYPEEEIEKLTKRCAELAGELKRICTVLDDVSNRI